MNKKELLQDLYSYNEDLLEVIIANDLLKNWVHRSDYKNNSRAIE
ncbi:hypothetical protein [Streptococcus infantarius]|uniref:Uncharacterized protein n=1 Tax=Streptococcus infantarius subsp. infantarius ATCC BAA-102 TaxID=471872 RepID=A0ABM9XG50_9STRE|nr:hypothetical protein [Streptococcus infantarius]EDT48295.1 hypothetical protein STRINF_00479 [Streptococcus infantarius subsp. infantarius ATCC BAA-102]